MYAGDQLQLYRFRDLARLNFLVRPLMTNMEGEIYDVTPNDSQSGKLKYFQASATELG